MKKNNRKASGRPAETGLEPMTEAPLSRMNFYLMIFSAIVIIVGFLLMLGSGTGTDTFNEDIFSMRRIVIGPTIAFVGFIFMGFSIIYRPKQGVKSTTEEGGHA